MGRARLALSVVFAAALVGCGLFSEPTVDVGNGGIETNMGGGGGTAGPGGGFATDAEFGATQGGVQDLGLAREYIANGTVPPPEAFVVEAMFSEHDLPLAGDRCDTVLCLRGEVGIAPTLDGIPSGWMQVGMSSTINPDTFEREAQNLVFTVDISCSMGWDYSRDENEYPSAGGLARKLMEAISPQLDAQDNLAIVTYGSEVKTVLEWTPGDAPEVDRAISALDDGGSTNMEAGLREAFALARRSPNANPTRVMLFTDVRPNVGATTASQFETMVAEAASEDIGLTLFGLGLGLGPETFEAMSHLRGGNAFSLFAAEDVARTMDESWPWMVSPIAFDLAFDLVADAGYEIAEAYGVPGGDDPSSAGFEVASVFLSRRRGALLLRVAPTGTADLAGLRVSGTLAYTTPEGVAVDDRLEAVLDGSEPLDRRGQFFPQHSVGKTVALAVLVDGMKRAAEAYEPDRDEALRLIDAVVERFEADAASLDDAALDPELTLVRTLGELMHAGAPQTDLYGGTR